MAMGSTFILMDLEAFNAGQFLQLYLNHPCTILPTKKFLFLIFIQPRRFDCTEII